MAGCLHVVSTPIGNLDDITLRALRVLREAGLIAAEDTRRTARLLQHYSISTPTTSLHEHNERKKVPALIARLQAGDRIAPVRDAGNTRDSDPGTRPITAAHDAGVKVEVVPGPSAVLAALAASGFPAEPFRFVGFPPVRSKDRKKWMASVSSGQETTVFFEAPHRIERTLTELALFSVERPILVCRELTKLHEELVRGPINGVRSLLCEPRGEYVVVLGPLPAPREALGRVPEDAELAALFGQITESGAVNRREAIREIADRHGLKVRDVYQAIERVKRPVS